MVTQFDQLEVFYINSFKAKNKKKTKIKNFRFSLA